MAAATGTTTTTASVAQFKILQPIQQLQQEQQARKQLINLKIKHLKESKSKLLSNNSNNNNTIKTNALHQTILDGRIKQFSYFLKMGSKVNSRDKYGRTCLMLACLSDHEEYGLQVAKLLLKNGAEINIQDQLGRSALCMACDVRREKLFNYLIDNHGTAIDFRLKDNDNNILLNHVAVNGTVAMTKKLLDKMAERRIDVDQRNKNGCTALLLAIQNEKYLNAYTLLTVGQASPSLKDNDRFLNALEWLLYKINVVVQNTESNNDEKVSSQDVIQNHSPSCSQLYEQTSLGMYSTSLNNNPNNKRNNSVNYKTWYTSSNQYFTDGYQCEHMNHPNYSTEYHKSTYIPLILTPRIINNSNQQQQIPSLYNQRISNQSDRMSMSTILNTTPSPDYYETTNKNNKNEINEMSTTREIIQKLYETIYKKMSDTMTTSTQNNNNQSTSSMSTTNNNNNNRKSSLSLSSDKTESSSSTKQQQPQKPANHQKNNAKQPTLSKKSSIPKEQHEQEQEPHKIAPVENKPVVEVAPIETKTKKQLLPPLNIFNMESMRQTPKLLALIPESRITIKQGVHCIYELYDANLLVSKSTSRTTNNSSNLESSQDTAPTKGGKKQFNKSNRGGGTASKLNAATKVKFNVDD